MGGGGEGTTHKGHEKKVKLYLIKHLTIKATGEWRESPTYS
jgi:hypothetical protein